MKEFKIINFPTDNIYHVFKEDDFSPLEKALEEYSKNGWEVVSVCPNNYIDNIHGEFLITLQRDKY